MLKDLLPGNIGSFAATAALTLLASCSFQPAQQATDAEAQMVGMTKQQVYTCMGVPAQKAQEGSAEIWTYSSGDGHTATFTDATIRRFCTVNVAFQNARVSQVSYVGSTGGPLTEHEQCPFAVKNCLQQGR